MNSFWKKVGDQQRDSYPPGKEENIHIEQVRKVATHWSMDPSLVHCTIQLEKESQKPNVSLWRGAFRSHIKHPKFKISCALALNSLILEAEEIRHMRVSLDHRRKCGLIQVLKSFQKLHSLIAVQRMGWKNTDPCSSEERVLWIFFLWLLGGLNSKKLAVWILTNSHRVLL